MRRGSETPKPPRSEALCPSRGYDSNEQLAPRGASRRASRVEGKGEWPLAGPRREPRFENETPVLARGRAVGHCSGRSLAIRAETGDDNRVREQRRLW